MHPMIIVVLVLAVVILIGFGTVWFKDKDRTQEQSHDGGRMDA